jgi:hypothetical protein
LIKRGTGTNIKNGKIIDVNKNPNRIVTIDSTNMREE